MSEEPFIPGKEKPQPKEKPQSRDKDEPSRERPNFYDYYRSQYQGARDGGNKFDPNKYNRPRIASVFPGIDAINTLT
jgi:hypothetical protein